MIKYTLLALLFVSPAFAEVNCADHNLIVQNLANKYNEALFGMGLDNNQNLIEFYINPETGTWTALLTMPSMNTCIVSNGTNFEFQAPPKSESDIEG